jgi:hypothetical protein
MTLTIELSEDILLEIFDAYRRLYETDSRYENIWNSRDGWFKLTHVCRSWRRLVHLSPSRLHVYLLFTPRRSLKALLLKNLPSLPILVDYRFAKWTNKEVSLALAAIEHRGRVRGISLRTKSSTETAKIFKAFSHPFPELEGLEIYFSHDYDFAILPTTFLLGSALCLRRLKLRHVDPMYLSPLLSTATGLVKLELTLRVPHNALPEESFVADLQRLSCLRRLELRLTYLPSWHNALLNNSPWPPSRTGDIVPLPNLMQLVFTGHHTYLEALVVGLAAPSLQQLDTKLTDEPETNSFPLPHFSRFICNTGNQFSLVHLDFSHSNLQFTAGTRSKSVLAQPSIRILVPHIWLSKIGNRLSGPLATVEELDIKCNPSSDRRVIQWHGFFNHLRQVKVLQVPWQFALGVAHSFQQDGQQPTTDLLPALEQVLVDMDLAQLYPRLFGPSNPDHVIIPDAFEPLISARKKVGRPIELLFI